MTVCLKSAHLSFSMALRFHLNFLFSLLQLYLNHFSLHILNLKKDGCLWKTVRKVSIVTNESINTENASTSPSDTDFVFKPLGYGVFVPWNQTSCYSSRSSTYLNPFCSLCLHLCSSSALPWTWQDCWNRLCRVPRGKVNQKMQSVTDNRNGNYPATWKGLFSNHGTKQNRPRM